MGSNSSKSFLKFQLNIPSDGKGLKILFRTPGSTWNIPKANLFTLPGGENYPKSCWDLERKVESQRFQQGTCCTQEKSNGNPDECAAPRKRTLISREVGQMNSKTHISGVISIFNLGSQNHGRIWG